MAETVERRVRRSADFGLASLGRAGSLRLPGRLRMVLGGLFGDEGCWELGGVVESCCVGEELLLLVEGGGLSLRVLWVDEG